MAFIRSYNSDHTSKPVGSYSQAVKLSDFSELVFVSGQVPEDADGDVPEDFDAQCRLVWTNVERQLDESGFGLTDIVKVTTFLSHPSQRDSQSAIRNEVLGEHKPALTVILCDIYASKWLLEIEAIAAR